MNFYQKPGSSNLIGWELEVGMSADPNQLASLETNWSGSTLFAKTGHVVFRLLELYYCYKFIYLMVNSADPDQLSQLIWIYTVCKGRVYPGSEWQGLNATNSLPQSCSSEPSLQSFFPSHSHIPSMHSLPTEQANWSALQGEPANWKIHIYLIVLGISQNFLVNHSFCKTHWSLINNWPVENIFTLNP